MSLCACSKTEPINKTEIALDTVVSITVYDSKDEALLDDAIEMVQRYESLFSSYEETSDIYKINHSNGEEVFADADTIELLEKGIYYSKLSEGRFDITCGALNELWHITDNEGDIPTQEEIDTALDTIDYNNIVIDKDKSTVRLLNKDTRIDLGAIAKGYIADKVKQYLSENGVKSAMINLGGNVLLLGRKSGGDFTIGIPTPFEIDKVAKTITAHDTSIVTSGNYQRYFEKDGKLYHHIMDLSIGYPADSGVSSVTIITANSVDADALSTICYIYGKSEGEQFIKTTGLDVDTFWIE